MGFLNALTGGGATIQLQLQKDRFQAGEPVFAWVTVIANDNINTEGVVLHIMATEHTHGGHCQRCNTTVGDRSEAIYNNEMVIAGPQQMMRGEQRQFQGSIQIPMGIPPTYQGRNASNRWFIEARVKMFGNDPDTRREIIVFG